MHADAAADGDAGGILGRQQHRDPHRRAHAAQPPQAKPAVQAGQPEAHHHEVGVHHRQPAGDLVHGRDRQQRPFRPLPGQGITEAKPDNRLGKRQEADFLQILHARCF